MSELVKAVFTVGGVVEEFPGLLVGETSTAVRRSVVVGRFDFRHGVSDEEWPAGASVEVSA